MVKMSQLKTLVLKKRMKMMNNYYLNNYPDKFIKDKTGMLIPEIYAKDEYGMDTGEVIKHSSYIHSSVDNVDEYVNPKTYTGSSVEEAYAQFLQDLYDENNWVEPEK